MLTQPKLRPVAGKSPKKVAVPAISSKKINIELMIKQINEARKKKQKRLQSGLSNDSDNGTFDLPSNWSSDAH